jgi:hypothetical protein
MYQKSAKASVANENKETIHELANWMGSKDAVI